MAQNFWIAILSWSTCFVVTVPVSLATAPHADADLQGLVRGLANENTEAVANWYERPIVLAAAVAVVLLGLNVWVSDKCGSGNDYARSRDCHPGFSLPSWERCSRFWDWSAPTSTRP